MILDGGVWDDEVAKWTPGMDVTQVAYSALSGREKTDGGGTRPTGKLKDEYKRDWGTVVLDEAHYVKGRKTNWTLAVKQLAFDRLIQLTGTPLPNWAHEAFVLLQLLFPEGAKPGGTLGSYWRWAAQWFEIGELRDRAGRLLTSHDIGDLHDGLEWDDFRSQNWGQSMLRRLRVDCLDLPPLTETTYALEMKPTQAKAYRELKKDFISWLESGEEIVAWNQAAQMVKLAKCATGLEVLSPDDRGSNKLDALEDILRDRPLPTLVVAHFRDSVAQCAHRAVLAGKTAKIVDGGTARKERASTVRSFQAGNLDVLCATIDTISEGLTLNAADQIIRVERSYRPSRNTQVRDRIYRIGQERPVTCIDLVSRGTVDERILSLLESKTDQQVAALGDRELREMV
jgi:SNF2 family DNA or RNA helicase